MLPVDQYESNLIELNRRYTQVRVTLSWGAVVAGVLATAAFLV